jgi:RNA polymerase sigma-70 factor, ECF subfamily
MPASLKLSSVQVSQIPAEERRYGVSAPDEAIVEMSARDAAFDLEAAFRAHYPRIARTIARVVRNPARAEELAVDVFLKLSKQPAVQGEHVAGWLYRTAVRAGLDELRRAARRARFERLAGRLRGVRTPEEIYNANEDQEKVRTVLAMMGRRGAELLILRAQGLTYEELAAFLRLNPASVGTLLARAERAFRKEYVSRYGYA